MFADIARACGLTGKLTDLEALYFQPCMIRLKIEEAKNGQYEDQNRVTRVLPVGAMATPEQIRQAQANQVKKMEALAEASKTPSAFKATDEELNDDLPSWAK